MLHDFFFPGQPLFSERAAMTLIGKRVRVWVVYEDENRRRLGDDEYHGRIIRASRREGIVIQTPSGGHRTVPADLRGLVRAPRQTSIDFWSSWALPRSSSEESSH
jgi:hypothetical protein